MKKNIEILFVIDVSANMQLAMREILETILELPDALDDGARSFKYFSGFSNIRVKMMTFCDVRCEIKQSRWFNIKCSKKKHDSANKKLIMPSILSFSDYERTEFIRFVRNDIKIKDGSHSDLFNGLEALSKAVQTDWTISNNTFDYKCRHTIIFITLNGTELRTNSDQTNCICSENLSDRLNKLSNIWLNRKHNAIKVPEFLNLVIFAPYKFPWTSIYELWDSVAFYPIESASIFEDFMAEDLWSFFFGEV